MGGSSEQLQHARIDGRCRNVIFRQTQLVELHDAVKSQSVRCAEVIKETQNVNGAAATLEVLQTLREIEQNYKTLDLKASLEEEKAVVSAQVKTVESLVPHGAVSLTVKNSPNPFFDAIGCLSAIIAAGNACVINLHGVSETMADLIDHCLIKLDRDAFIVEKDADEQDEPEVDYSLCLGSCTDDQARQHSGLNGSCPIIVDRSANVQSVVEAITAAFRVSAKSALQGPFRIYIHEFLAEQFKTALVKAVRGPETQDVLEQFGIQEFTSPEVAMDDINDTAATAAFSTIYIFAEGDSIRYLSSNIHTPYHFINHIPRSWMIGSIPARSGSKSHWRFQPEMFSIKTLRVLPQEAQKSEAAKSLSVLQLQSAIEKQQISMPKRRPGKRIDFFLQGIFLFLGITSLSTIAVLSGSTVGLLRLYQRYSGYLLSR